MNNRSEEDKAEQDKIEAVFYDDEYGYGSKLNTLKHAREMNVNILVDDINKFTNKVSFLGIKTGIAILIYLLLISTAMHSWLI